MIRCLFWAIAAAAAVTAPIWIPALAHAETPTHQFNVCTALRNGAHLVDIETRLVAAGYTEHDAGVFTANMLSDHCPDQIDNVMAQLA